MTSAFAVFMLTKSANRVGCSSIGGSSVQPTADGRLFLFTLACAGSAVFLLPFLAAQLPGYEHVGQALRFCLRDLVKMKAVPARTCIARELGLDLGEQTLNAKGAGRSSLARARLRSSGAFRRKSLPPSSSRSKAHKGRPGAKAERPLG